MGDVGVAIEVQGLAGFLGGSHVGAGEAVRESLPIVRVPLAVGAGSGVRVSSFGGAIDGSLPGTEVPGYTRAPSGRV